MATSKQPFHRLISGLIDASEKTQRQIATEIGYRRSNVISMMKQGRMPIPLSKVPALAKALGADAAILLEAALREYHPALHDTLRPQLGMFLTENELDFICRLRARLGGVDVGYTDEMVEGIAVRIV